ncbi:MAG: hypothetical protein JWQ32_1989 [Marmoricola sp.]|nr:hypothetical protein [Marmoricola sp.]
MNLQSSRLTRAVSLGFVVLALSTVTTGTAHASRPLLEAPSMFVPSVGDIAVTTLVTSAQADNVRVELRDLRS